MQHSLVIFNAPWNDSCYFTYPLWAKLSNRYTTDKLKFLEVDVVQFDGLSRLNKVVTTGFSGALPALIMFEDGKETLRFPLAEKHQQSSWFSSNTPNYSEKDLIKYFDLDKRFLATNTEEVKKKKAAT
jgi:thiol-disulfide isomerase/thioredoxin